MLPTCLIGKSRYPLQNGLLAFCCERLKGDSITFGKGLKCAHSNLLLWS